MEKRKHTNVSDEKEQEFSRLAHEAFQKQNWDAAEMFCSKAIKAAPDSAKNYMFRGWIRAGRSRSIQDRRYYLEVLQAIISDYKKARDLAPNDPQAMISLIEAEICSGDAATAAKHVGQLWENTNEQSLKGLCAWMGAVACALADVSEEPVSDFVSHLDIAAVSIFAGSWNTADIHKYLNEYAGCDFPKERVRKALCYHSKVISAVNSASPEQEPSQFHGDRKIDKLLDELWKILSIQLLRQEVMPKKQECKAKLKGLIIEGNNPQTVVDKLVDDLKKHPLKYLERDGLGHDAAVKCSKGSLGQDFFNIYPQAKERIPSSLIPISQNILPAMQCKVPLS